MPLVKMQKKGQLTLPSQIRSRLGLTEGDFVDVKIQSAHIVVTPQVVIDRSKFPNVADEYTPEQRRIIDARLDEADNDPTRGQLYGPFDTHKKFIASLHQESKKLRTKKGKRPAK
jgi:AbrB family looped-hinge helix DNA binding protein